MTYFKNEQRLENLKKRDVDRKRRSFLSMVGKTGFSGAMLKASPLLLGTLASRQALAADENKFVIFMYLPNGAPNAYWLPNSESNMGLCTEPYADVAQYTKFSEVNMGQGGHGTTFRSMGSYEYSTQHTLDYHLAQNFPLSPHSVVRAGVQATGAEYFTREAGQQATHYDGPDKTFAALFNGTPTAAVGDTSYESVFEMTKKSLNTIKSKVGSDELQRLESHLASIEQIERRITIANNTPQDVSAACTSPEVFAGRGHIVDEGKATAEIVVAALSCGLTNVATIQLSNDQAGWFDGGRLDNISDTLNHHNTNHSGNEQDTATMVGLLSEVPAYLIKRLTQVNGPDGQPLINNTLFVQVSDMGDGNHGLSQAPFLMASGLPGFGGYSATTGGSHKSFMQSIPGILDLDGTVES